MLSIMGVQTFALGANIEFADATVKALCVANWDTDKDGELSYDEAAAVTDLGWVFKYNVEITSFDELQCFTGLTSIESDFMSCISLTSVTIPNSVTSIGDDAFYHCISLTSVTIPNSVTSIGNLAFYGCSSLTSVTIPNSVTSIGNGAFRQCVSLNSVTIPNSVTSIGNYAFAYCSGLTSVTISNSLTSIGGYAFAYCSGLTSVTIPNSVTSIGDFAFSSCSSLTSIVVDAGNSKYDSRISCNAIIETATNTLVVGCKNTTIPSSVTNIGRGAFDDCSGLTSVTIPNSVTSIEMQAFAGCGSLTNVIIPNSVTSIGDLAFSDCRGLTSVTIPNSVTSIGFRTFLRCSSLTSVSISNSVTSLGDRAFEDCSSLTSVTIPNGVTSIEGSAFSGCSSLTSIVVDADNSQFDSRNSCNAIIETATNTLVVGCKNTTIPSSVTSIGDHAFWGCSSLTSVTIPNSVTRIGEYAFYGCGSLTNVIIPNSVMSIGRSAFYICSGLTNVTIANSVTSIGAYAFYGCRNLSNVFCLATEVPSINSSCFWVTSIDQATLHVPIGSKDSYAAVSPWSNFGTIVEEDMGDDPLQTIVLTAEENNGVVDLMFNSVSNDLRYRVGRLDQNGKRKKVYETSVSQYPNTIHVVDNPLKGDYTYYVQAAYENADGTHQTISSNEVTISVTEASSETERTGVILGRVVFDNNVAAIIPPVVNINIKFSDGETVRMQPNGTFVRNGIALGTTLTLSIADNDYYTSDPITVNVTEQSLTQLQTINATRRDDAPAQISYENFDLTITSMITGIPNKFEFEVMNTSEATWIGNIELIAVRKKEANDVSSLTHGQVSFASVKTYNRVGNRYVKKLLPGKKTTIDLPITDFPVLTEDEYYTFYIVSRKSGEDNSGNFKLLACGHNDVTNPKDVLMVATSGGHDYSEFIESEVNACVAEIISIMGQLDKYSGPMSTALSDISCYLKEYERTKNAEGLLGNLPDLLKNFSGDLKNAIKDVQDFTDILKDVNKFYKKLEAINEFRNADDFKKFIILSETVFEYSGLPFAGVYSYYFDIAENAVNQIKKYMQKIIDAELSQSFEDDAVEIRIKVRKNNWSSWLWTSNFRPTSVASQIKKVDVHLCSKNYPLTSETDGRWYEATYVPEASDDYVVLRRVSTPGRKETSHMEKTQRFWAEIFWYNGRVTKVPLLYEDMVDYDGSSRIKPKITVTLQSGSSSVGQMADKIELVTKYD